MEDKIIRRYVDGNGNIGYHFYCPGCKSAHGLPTVQGLIERDPSGKIIKGKEVPIWSFNGVIEKPTFRPSVLAKWNKGDGQIPQICHSYITNGEIEFLADCTHNLKGQTLKLDPW